jgi:hypothetical protein
VAEWLKAPVLKTGVRETVPGVRIPPSPPFTRTLSYAGAGSQEVIPGEYTGRPDRETLGSRFLLSRAINNLLFLERPRS